MRLYSYFRSSASYRVRIALGLKKLDFTKLFLERRPAPGDPHRLARVQPQEAAEIAVEPARRIETFEPLAKTEHILDAVTVVQLQKNRADDVVQAGA